MMKLAIALCALLVAAAAVAPVDDLVMNALKTGQNLDIIVLLPARESAPRERYAGMTRAQRRVAVHDALVKHAEQYQTPVIERVKAQGFEVKSFWINNSILIKSATPALITLIRGLKHVTEIIAVADVAHIETPMIHDIGTKTNNALEWNLLIVNIEGAWNLTQGEGVTLSNIDTGVRYTHEALRASYRGNNGGAYNHDYNWFDPSGNQVPFDNNGHGTHTMGTITGAELNGIGVAPGAKWIAAKGCASSSCSNAHLIASAEWVICPTRQGGAGEDCTQGADVVNNSWGGGRGSNWYITYVQAWVEAGSVPVFSQGNSGSSCSTANSPGDYYNVIGVGSTTSTDSLSSFSSRGPGVGTTQFPLQKPEISAPGDRVVSSYYSSDTSYATLSGTSMASPHVTGIVGLVLSANPTLDFEDVKTIIYGTAKQGLPAPTGGQTTCAGIPYTQYPNYHYGFGRIDAAAAVHSAFSFKK